MKQKLSTILPILFSTVLFDQLTKIWAKAYLKDQRSFHYLYDSIRIVYAENKGAFLSFGSSLPDHARFLIFSIITGLVLVVGTFLLIRSKTISKTDLICFSFILGGGFGNLIDRAFYGYVADFMNVGIGSLRTGIFNVADMAITFAVIYMVYDGIVNKKKKDNQVNSQEASKKSN
ncbi:MAG: signal peptidase II [Halobacteriovoraceae bacterium]|nr:signal peptidase II [Halobacteriovoraceae bacterium]